MTRIRLFARQLPIIRSPDTFAGGNGHFGGNFLGDNDE